MTKNILALIFFVAGTVLLVVAAAWLDFTRHQAGVLLEGKVLEEVLSNGIARGDVNAPVTVLEFGDYQCPACGAFFKNIEPLLEEYVQKGKVRFVWHDIAFLGPESKWAAQAAWCANDQQKYWEYHTKLFNEQKGENQGAFSIDNLKRFAIELGLNSEQFNTCIDNETYKLKVDRATAESNALGIVSTPTYFLNGKKFVGVPSYEQFKVEIDRILLK
jgi:protein-disulfide isomerase